MAEAFSQPLEHQSVATPTASDKRQSFTNLLAQLHSRNSHNTAIIKKFLRKISRRQASLPQLTSRSQQQHLRHLTLQVNLYQPTTASELQQAQQWSLSDPHLKDSSLFKTADTQKEGSGEAEKGLAGQEKSKVFGKQKTQKYNLNPASISLNVKHQAYLDPNFGHCLKGYVKQVLEKKQEKRIKGVASQLRKPLPAHPSSKFINLRSLVLGSHELSCAADLQELPLNLKHKRVQTEGTGGSYKCIHNNSRGPAGYKLSNNFLPLISRQLGKVRKRELANLQRRLRMGEGRNDYRYDMQEVDSMERIGISFRINALPIKKHY